MLCCILQISRDPATNKSTNIASKLLSIHITNRKHVPVKWEKWCKIRACGHGFQLFSNRFAPSGHIGVLIEKVLTNEISETKHSCSTSTYYFVMRNTYYFSTRNVENDSKLVYRCYTIFQLDKNVLHFYTHRKTMIISWHIRLCEINIYVYTS